MSLEQVSRKYVTRAELAALFNANGYPITLTYLNYLCSPAVDKGPPAAGRFGSWLMYEPPVALKWAEKRLRESQQSAA